jgi:hypothetical protein
MRDIGRVLGFFNAYSKLQTGSATYHSRYSAASLCSSKFLKKSKDALDSEAPALQEDDCRCLYMEGWSVGQKQGMLAFETHDLDVIGEIARLAGQVAPFYTDYTTAENDARDCRVRDEVRTHFITNWRETGGDKRKQVGV